MSFLSDRRREARRASNDRFSTPAGLLPLREPRRQGVIDHLGGDERARDIEDNAASLYQEDERDALSAKLNGAPEEAMDAVVGASAFRY